MTTEPEPDRDLQPGMDMNAEVDPGDMWTAFYMGTRELSDAEYEQCAAAHNADVLRALEAREADNRLIAAENMARTAAAIAEAECELEAG